MVLGGPQLQAFYCCFTVSLFSYSKKIQFYSIHKQFITVKKNIYIAKVWHSITFIRILMTQLAKAVVLNISATNLKMKSQ